MTVWIRIALRYIAGFLIARGLVDPAFANEIVNDPHVAAAIEVAIGAAIIAATEGWYWIAKRLGWKT